MKNLCGAVTTDWCSRASAVSALAGASLLAPALSAACLAIILHFGPHRNRPPARRDLLQTLEERKPVDGTNPTVSLGFVVYFDLRASTMIVSPFAVPPGSRRDYQLWLVPEGSAPPISLGVHLTREPTMSPWLARTRPAISCMQDLPSA